MLLEGRAVVPGWKYHWSSDSHVNTGPVERRPARRRRRHWRRIAA